jgi:hypothetical protein
MDEKYDYRYSVLLLVFARLQSESWLSRSELSGLAREKLEYLDRIRSLSADRA